MQVVNAMKRCTPENEICRPRRRGTGSMTCSIRQAASGKARKFQRIIMIPLLLVGWVFATAVNAAPASQPAAPVGQARDGKLAYRTYDRGDRVPDFSHAGYMAGESAIPDVPIRVRVSPIDGDNTARIQSAIDYVASLPLDEHGFRGAILLEKGKFDIAGALSIRTSGVVLRGSGTGDNGTTLVATGLDRRTLISFTGLNDRKTDGQVISISDAYVPVNAMRFSVADASNLKPGDTIQIRRPSTADWIKALGIGVIGGEVGGWKAGTRDILWDRKITAIDGNHVTIDAPLTTALDATFGGGAITRYSWPGRINNVGVENLRCESTFDAANPKDEAHSWMAINFENTQDAWVRRVTAAHFAGSMASIWDSCKRITTEDCRSLDPISEIAGYRRHTFFTNGQQTLFQRCWSENGRHDFSAGICAAGPNAFVQCEAINALDDSGSIDSWATGLLFDNVRIDGNAIRLANVGYRNTFSGWNAANSMLWNCSAALIECFNPPTSHNWAMGCWGQFNGNGEWDSVNETIRPASLYYAQLADRIGSTAAMSRADLLLINSDASSSPSMETAAKLIAASTQPVPLLSDWIDRANDRHPMVMNDTNAKRVDEVAATETPSPAAQPKLPMTLLDGRLMCGDQPLVGGRQSIQWWRGGIHPADLVEPEKSITRYVPGRIGPGLTDDLEQIANGMVRDHRVALEQHYGLWYDRRNDDHERVRRMNGDAWPPFYELPFARSGQGVAWDGLSKYDLTQYNPWYFSRVQQFASLCDQKGLVLINQQFFQHNIIEAGAHWASCPWRTANNINNTGFPEPPPYAGDKRIFMAEQFYDVSNTTRRNIYRAYIRKCLDNLAGNTNVIQETSDEFTGPLHFVQFWIDTIAEWEKETGKHPIIGLACTKDVQDAILADANRAKVVDVIDIRYWYYQSDGEAYAPPGGKNLAPRQFERILKHKAASPQQVERAVKEYRQKFPDKAVIYSADGADRAGQAITNAGGSLANVPGHD